jgi:hypothetical protein
MLCIVNCGRGETISEAVGMTVSMILVWSWFWWTGRPERIRQYAGRERPWFRSRTPDQQYRYQRATHRWVAMPIATVLVIISVGALGYRLATC